MTEKRLNSAALSRLLCGAFDPCARTKPDAANLSHSFAYTLSRRAGCPRPVFAAAAAPAPGATSRPAVSAASSAASSAPPSASGAATAGLAPYDHDLQRLAEILGALHFLRGICGSNEGQKWRNEAHALIDAEAPAGERRDRMVASFNRGYRAFQQSYRTCTPAADFAVRRYLDEGARIAREITARYAD